MQLFSLGNVTDWAISGVDHSIEGNGGPDCVKYLSPNRRLYETIFATILALIYLYWGIRRIHIPPVPKISKEDRGGRRSLLMLMCLVLGMEIGFKFSSKTVIYFLNPCHIVTMIQIFLLSVPPSRLVTTLFRIQIHCLNGPLLAIFFPVLNTRELPMELESYWIQHILMLIIPFYLLRTGMNGAYTVECLKDFSWTAMTLGILFLYHFILLQILGIVTQVNLNSMVCPAVSDPFRGQNYRLWAIGHQTLLVLIAGKLYTIISLTLLQITGSLEWNGEKYIVLVKTKDRQFCPICSACVQKNNCNADEEKIKEE
ncbi:transmembrane protein 164 [Centruroides vittatus]|uniref:transmembrane protein 164 n=1 Tax=Centruroides vittatus TaxID=120091 RepID=UPI00351001B4